MAEKKMTEKLFEYAEERYGTKPEYLWSRVPDAAVLRCESNNKWYGLIMTVDGSKLGLEKGVKYDIVNVKCSPLMTGSLISVRGILPAYHMQKTSWVSILLDGSADEEQVFSLLDMSYELVRQGGKGKALRTEPKEWLIPASPAMYDVEQDFRRDGTILWKQTANMIVGDIVYMYMASPISAVMYKCEATEVNIPYNYDDGDYHIRKAVKLKLLCRFGKVDMPLSAMKELGVSAVRGARGVPRALSSVLKKLQDKGK